MLFPWRWQNEERHLGLRSRLGRRRLAFRLGCDVTGIRGQRLRVVRAQRGGLVGLAGRRRRRSDAAAADAVFLSRKCGAVGFRSRKAARAGAPCRWPCCFHELKCAGPPRIQTWRRAIAACVSKKKRPLVVCNTCRQPESRVRSNCSAMRATGGWRESTATRK